MKITDIVQKIENPNLCISADTKAFEDLIEKYPYAQSFPILLLKTLGQAKDIHFDDALNKHAFRISDRMHLYYVINEPGVYEVADKSEVASFDGEEIEVASSELRIESFDVDEKALTRPEENEGKFVRLDYEELLNEDIQFQKVEEMTFDPVSIDMAEQIESHESAITLPEIETSDLLEGEIKNEISRLEEPTSAIAEEEIKTEGADLEITAKVMPEASIESSETEAIESSDGEEINNSSLRKGSFDPTLEIESSTVLEDLSILKPSSFEEQRKIVSLDFIEKKFDSEKDELTSNAIAQSYHITLVDDGLRTDLPNDGSHIEKNIQTSPIEITIEKFEEKNSSEKRSFFAWLHANEKIDNPEKNIRSTEIIEKFIQEEPKITRSVKEEETIEKKKTPFFKATETAKESLKESGIPISATLAKIFEAQGNFPKAIHSYEQLSLLYPEKKTFFANQIKKLKKKLNN